MSYFAITASLLFIFINFYSYRSLSKNYVLMKFKKSLAVIFILLFIFELLFFISLKNGELHGIIYKISIFSIGISFMLFCVLILYDGLLFGTSKFNKSRRKALKFLLDITVLIGFFSYLFKGVYNASYNTVITFRKVTFENLKQPLNIAILSDIHIGEFLRKDFLQGLVDQVNSLNVDAVFLVGDIVDLSADKLGDILDPLNDLRSKFGTFLVVGNHEYYHGIEELLVKFKSLNLKVLENESVSFGGINLAGVYDIAGLKMNTHKPDFSKALANLDRALPTVLLTHQPKSLSYLNGEVDLAVCGHTHAGQIFPFSLLVWLDQKYVYGLYKLSKKMQLLVSGGVGFWGPPMRILSKSEIVYLSLNKEG